MAAADVLAAAVKAMKTHGDNEEMQLAACRLFAACCMSSSCAQLAREAGAVAVLEACLRVSWKRNVDVEARKALAVLAT